MKQLVCEMCGSTEMLKQDGVYVCQTCGTKYTVEEAKKMMVEGTVEVQGTVQVDNSEKIQNYFELAREAKDENDCASAIKYYRLILEEYPNNWEARFYSMYYKVRQSSLRDVMSMLKKLENSADSVLTAIKADEHIDDQAEYVLEVATKILELAVMVHSSQMEESGSASADFLFAWGDKLEEHFPDSYEIVDQASLFWETAINIAYEHFFAGGAEFEEIILRYVEKIKKYNPDYVKPQSKSIVHTYDSPNNASVEIIKWGHTDFTTLPLIPVPVQYIAPGPDSAGGMSVELKLRNNRGKTIKYATLFVTALNQLGDPAPCSVHNEATRALSITGPIEAGKDSGKLIFETIWYNPTIANIKLSRMIIEYSDGSKELYDYTKNNNKSTSSSKNRTITITRKWAYVGCAVKMLVYKDDVEVFQLKASDCNSFVADNQPFELRIEGKGNPNGAHSIIIEAGEENMNFEVQISMTGKIKLQRA